MKVNINRGKTKNTSNPFGDPPKNTLKNNKLNSPNVSQKIKNNNISKTKNMPYRRSP